MSLLDKAKKIVADAKAKAKEEEKNKPLSPMEQLLADKEVKDTARYFAKHLSQKEALDKLNDLLREANKLPVVDNKEQVISTGNFRKLLPKKRVKATEYFDNVVEATKKGKPLYLTAAQVEALSPAKELRDVEKKIHDLRDKTSKEDISKLSQLKKKREELMKKEASRIKRLSGATELSAKVTREANKILKERGEHLSKDALEKLSDSDKDEDQKRFFDYPEVFESARKEAFKKLMDEEPIPADSALDKIINKVKQDKLEQAK